MKIKTNTTILNSVLIMILIFTYSSCGSTNTSQGTSTGAVIGGLLDGWEGAATGALIGGGVGLMEDTAEDKKIRQQQKERELAMLEKSRISADAKTAQTPKNSNKLTGSTWSVVSLVDDEKKTSDFSSMILTFQTNTRATTLILWADGKSETYSERYIVVSDALVFTGKDYITNAQYSITANQMILVTPTMRVVLEEVEEGI